jgi:hypothetical protein
MFTAGLRRQIRVRSVFLTSVASTFIFALLYGIIEHTLLTSSLGIRILTYPLNIHLFGQLYFYHVLMLALAILISFNQFLDLIIFGNGDAVRRQSILWGSGNILNFIWLEDMFYFVSFGEWPKDVMTPLNLSFYGIVWWYPIMLGSALAMYVLASRTVRNMNVNDREHSSLGRFQTGNSPSPR